MDDVSPRPRPAATTITGPNRAGALLPAATNPVAAALLARLDAEHPMLSGLPPRERLLTAAWLGSYRSARTRRAYAGDLAPWLHWLHTNDVDVLNARRVHVDLWVRQLLDAAAASSSTSRRLSALSSFYRHLVEHDLIAANPAAAVRRPTVDPDHTATVGLDRAADITDLGHDRGHRVLSVTRKGGRRATVVLPPPTAAALDTYLLDRLRTHPAPAGPGTGELSGPLLATVSGGWLDQGALWKLVRRLARAADIPSWTQMSPHSLRHTAITLALDAGAALRDVQDYTLIAYLA